MFAELLGMSRALHCIRFTLPFQTALQGEGYSPHAAERVRRRENGLAKGQDSSSDVQLSPRTPPVLRLSTCLGPALPPPDRHHRQTCPLGSPPPPSMVAKPATCHQFHSQHCSHRASHSWIYPAATYTSPETSDAGTLVALAARALEGGHWVGKGAIP